jgi:hypothetical protein
MDGKDLPGAAHMRKDQDFDPVRDTPEFVAWWRQTFGPDEPVSNVGPADPAP